MLSYRCRSDSDTNQDQTTRSYSRTFFNLTSRAAPGLVLTYCPVGVLTLWRVGSRSLCFSHWLTRVQQVRHSPAWTAKTPATDSHTCSYQTYAYWQRRNTNIGRAIVSTGSSPSLTQRGPAGPLQKKKKKKRFRGPKLREEIFKDAVTNCFISPCVISLNWDDRNNFIDASCERALTVDGRSVCVQALVLIITAGLFNAMTCEQTYLYTHNTTCTWQKWNESRAGNEASSGV